MDKIEGAPSSKYYLVCGKDKIPQRIERLLDYGRTTAQRLSMRKQTYEMSIPGMRNMLKQQ